MLAYAKIQSIYKRDEKTYKFIEGKFSLPEFEYLKDNIWVFTEKINGTNIRVIWDGMEKVEFRGRTDKAQISTFLLDKLKEMFPIGRFRGATTQYLPPLCLYGEGYGARIQKGGGKYIPDGISFILFDVKIDKWWLKREDVEEIAKQLEIDAVPIMGEGTLDDAIQMIKKGVESTFGDFLAEGLVLKPKIDLLARSGHRIITKIKHSDF